MEYWQDQGIVLSVRPHGENGAIVALLTEEHGRHAGYVRGIHSAKMRGILEPGNFVAVEWQSRVADNLGTYKLEQNRQIAAMIMDNPLKLGALLSSCSLCDAALPEREGHAGLFYGLQALMDSFESEIWGVSYVMWEIALLRELGFGLDFSRCAGGGDSDTLTYISPKSGRAISAAEGEIYKDKLLLLPDFLRPQGQNTDDHEVYMGLKMTGYFMKNWVFAHHSKGVPEDRLRFEARFAKYIEQSREKLESTG